MAVMVLDIGGTAIKSALYNEGTLTDIKETPTQAAQGGSHVVNRIKEIIKEYQKDYSFERIGISTAGQVDPVRGEIVYANQNIPGYMGTKLKKIMEEEFHVPTKVENDVNSAAIAESVFGVGKPYKEFVCLTYGTGVGGAIFANGKLYTGSSYCAGEFGAIVTHPEDRILGKDMFVGCYEKYASVTALVNSALRVDASLTNGRKIFERIGEPEVKEVVDRWILEIIYGLTTIIHMLNPECVILGGGVMEQPYVLERLREQLYQHIMSSYHHVMIEKAALGNRAGMLGAAVL
ncbi:ROK family protein [Lachnospiraceae bacterium MD335]|nr:ROK family protein [Lachnospiraceae bacterium MD335]